MDRLAGRPDSTPREHPMAVRARPPPMHRKVDTVGAYAIRIVTYLAGGKPWGGVLRIGREGCVPRAGRGRISSTETDTGG